MVVIVVVIRGVDNVEKLKKPVCVCFFKRFFIHIPKKA